MWPTDPTMREPERRRPRPMVWRRVKWHAWTQSPMQPLVRPRLACHDPKSAVTPRNANSATTIHFIAARFRGGMDREVPILPAPGNGLLPYRAITTASRRQVIPATRWIMADECKAGHSFLFSANEALTLPTRHRGLPRTKRMVSTINEVSPGLNSGWQPSAIDLPV